MGNLIMKNGVVYGIGSEAVFIDMAAAQSMQPAKPAIVTKPYDQMNIMPWSPWGSNNLLGAEMACDLKKTGVLNGIVEGKTRFSICQGAIPAIIETDTTGQRIVKKVLNNTDINYWMDDNNMFFTHAALAKDYVGFNRAIGRIGINNKGDQITRLIRADVSESRMAKKDSRGRINHVWYSADWAKVRGETDENVFKEPLLDPSNSYQDLQNRIDNGDKTRWFSVMVSHPGWQEQYYPMPMWMAQILWVKIAQGVPEMKAVLFENNMRVKMVVIIYESFWTEAFGDEWDDYTDEQKEEKRKKVYKDIDDFLVGSKNAYKSVFTTGYRDSEGKTYANIEFKPIEDTTKDGELLPDSAAANSEIAFSMLWNLAITGGTQKAGQYQGNEGGSNVRESSLMQVIIHEVERQMIRSIMHVIKRFNKWDVKYPGLDFIIPATILTTLDTGAGSKQVITGGANPNNNGKTTN
jgi:hypothetical protein